MDSLQRAHLIEEARSAHAEAARIAEMLAFLAPRMDASNARQLRIELFVARKRAMRIVEALEELTSAVRPEPESVGLVSESNTKDEQSSRPSVATPS